MWGSAELSILSLSKDRLVRSLRSVGAVSGAADGPLPARVQSAIAEEQHRSEVLISWAQLIIIGFFSLLYLAAPRPSDAGDFATWPLLSGHDLLRLLIVPAVLGLYALLTVGRLVLAYRRRLAGWMLVVSVILDITMLLALIWSFHIQYDQPPALYLKAPTLLYVFILIALRALRFEATYVILAGCVAVGGWIAMVFYAVYFSDPASRAGFVTNNYVEYMSSLKILIGGEIDKIAAIVTVTVILAIIVSRARGILRQAFFDTSAVNELKRFFSPEVAARITRAESVLKPGEAEYRMGAILFADIRGFTKLVKHVPAAEALQLLGEYQERLVPIIHAHGGRIDKFLGDGILASFGVVHPSQTYAADAIRAIEELATQALEWESDRRQRGLSAPQIGISMVAGHIMFGIIGGHDRLEYTVVGDTVNLAAKLEKHTKEEQATALTNLATFNLARQQGYHPSHDMKFIESAAVAGVDDRVDLVVIA